MIKYFSPSGPMSHVTDFSRVGTVRGGGGSCVRNKTMTVPRDMFPTFPDVYSSKKLRKDLPMHAV
jgi:hypothetical protein